ncbi:MAG: hypothetical protein ACK4GL_08900 [Flavobacteriales bacterium]
MSEFKQDIRVGYFPHNNTLKHPGDRRRFVFFAREVGLSFEIADPTKAYDIVYLTSSCNVSKWIAYKKKHPTTKLIFELIDSYVLVNKNVLRFLKGPYRYISGKDDRFYFDYNKAFLEIIQIADTVVCSTPVQKEYIQKFNDNVHVSLDYFEDEIPVKKTNHQIGAKIKLVWEGQSYTLENILVLREALQRVRNEVELHVITDRIIKGPFRFLDKQSEKLLDSLGVPYHFHEWNAQTFSRIAASADLAVIPLNHKKEMMWNKPENKLLFFWQLGLPVLTSPSPAYKRVMDTAQINMYARDTSEWAERIMNFKNLSHQEREHMFAKVDQYLNSHHTKDKLIEDWKNILEL